jgi:hypothetical protein
MIQENLAHPRNMVSCKAEMESLLKHLLGQLEHDEIEDIVDRRLDKCDRENIMDHIDQLSEDEELYDYDTQYVEATMDNLRFSITSEARTIVWKIEYVTPITTTVLCKYAMDL